MINEIEQTIVDELRYLYPEYNCYTDDKPDNFNAPAFLITVVEQEHTKLISNKYKVRVRFDISYFSADTSTGIISDCINVQERLLRNFNLFSNYRAINKIARITDNVLHFVFDVNYSELISAESDKMQAHTTNTNIIMKG